MALVNRNFRALRLDKGLSQSDFAKQFSLTINKVAAYELATEPRIATVQLVCSHYDLDLEEFLTKEYEIIKQKALLFQEQASPENVIYKVPSRHKEQFINDEERAEYWRKQYFALLEGYQGAQVKLNKLQSDLIELKHFLKKEFKITDKELG